MELGFRILIVSEIPDSLSCIPDSKSRDSGFHKPNFRGFWNPNSLTWGDTIAELCHDWGAFELNEGNVTNSRINQSFSATLSERLGI